MKNQFKVVEGKGGFVIIDSLEVQVGFHLDPDQADLYCDRLNAKWNQVPSFSRGASVNVEVLPGSVSRYRIEWMHNGNWRMEENGGGVYATLEEAEVARKNDSYRGLTTRIVEVRS
jgi:hypothetical protein